jgi:hypothetical protein
MLKRFEFLIKDNLNLNQRKKNSLIDKPLVLFFDYLARI